jgi:hypothetical protein
MFDGRATGLRATFVLLGVLAFGSVGYPLARDARWVVARPRIQDRFGPLAARVPADVTELGFVSDAPDVGANGLLLYEAQYALAPRTVWEKERRRFLVGSFRDPESLRSVCAVSSLTPVVVLPNGSCLLEAVTPP